MKFPSSNNVIRLILLLVIFMSCSPSTKIVVSNINDSGAMKPVSFIYALPLTVVDVQVLAEETAIIPGPYCKYAEKYLGIKDVPEKAESTWHILEMKISRHVEADPDYIFAMQGIDRPDSHAGISKLLSDSLILGPTDFSQSQEFYYNFPGITAGVVFTDLSVKRNFEAEKDIDISLVMPGTDDDATQAGRSTMKEKTPEQKAEEAANFLIKLKKRRFKLVAGQYDYMPAGEAMADALQELARLEEAYLSLFIGKRTIIPHRRNYSFVPASDRDSDRVVLFRFSDTEGFAGMKEAVGIPVVIELTDRNLTKALEQFIVPLKPSVNQIYYRIPDQVSLKLTAGENTWAEATYPVFQCGAIVPVMLAK
jgi:hypothetical protein